MHPLQKGYAEMFQRINCTIMVTLTYKREHVSNERAYLDAKAFVRDVAKKWKTQVAGHAVFNCLHNPHTHLFLIGKTKSIHGLTTAEANRIWLGGNADVQLRYSDWANKYGGQNITPHTPDKYDVFSFNMRYLKKLGFVKFKKVA